MIEHFGRIDILLNNAGVAVRGGVETLSQEDWDRSMNINVKGMYMMSKYVIPHMKAQNYGKIVNISSVNALIGDKNDMFIRHAYNTSKAAVLGLTLGMACSYGQFNITVNAVCPGLFESEMTQNTLFKSEAFLQGYSAQCPMGRPGRHGEVSGPVLFFSSDASSYVTGQRIIVDGGTYFCGSGQKILFLLSFPFFSGILVWIHSRLFRFSFEPDNDKIKIRRGGMSDGVAA